MRERGRKYYHENRDRQLKLAIDRTQKARRIKKKFLIQAKDRPCEDCGNKYPHYAMDFDHRKNSDKVVEVANLVSKNWSLNKIKNEVEKCDVVCSNCHRIRTFDGMPS
jgi:hypothetical protein